MKNLTETEAREKVFEMIKDIRVALLVTYDNDKRLAARPMSAQGKDNQGNLWFFTAKDSPKITEITANPNVLLSYSEPSDQNYVSLSGTAEIIDDQAKINEYWTEAAATWFPKGKTDPNICLIKIIPERAEYWDVPSSAIVYAYGYAKAKLTGQEPEIGDNRKVKMAS